MYSALHWVNIQVPGSTVSYPAITIVSCPNGVSGQLAMAIVKRIKLVSNKAIQIIQVDSFKTLISNCLHFHVGYQTRSRTVLRPPPLSVGKACPEPLWETRDCDIGPCIEYEWKVTDSGNIICVRSDGVIVDGESH